MPTETAVRFIKAAKEARQKGRLTKIAREQVERSKPRADDYNKRVK